MAIVQPFPGLRFARQPLSSVIAPPYDVISPEDQDRLYQRSPYNVIRLELGRGPDRYAEALDFYTAWRRDGILESDPPSLYLYEQRFAAPGSPEAIRIRRGIIARVRLEDWSAGVILPHEETLTGPKADRLRLMRTLWANVSPVFSLYEDPEARLSDLLGPAFEGPPLAQGAGDTAEEHRLWRLDEGPMSRTVQDFFSSRQLFIADGHHRYETALAVRDEARVQGRRYPGADYVMMVLVDFADPGLVVLPTHRLLHDLTGRMLQALADRLGDYFEVLAAADSPSPRAIEATLRQLDRTEGPAFALYGPPPNGLRLVALKPEWRGNIFDGRHSEAWNRLDVAVLHAVLGSEILGLREEDLASERYFSYTRDAAAAVRGVQRGEQQMVVLLRATPPAAIRDVALVGDKMPQKSTYFYPKLATGVVINPLDS